MKKTDPLKANYAKKSWQPMQLYIISIASGTHPSVHEANYTPNTHQVVTNSPGIPGVGWNFHKKVGAGPAGTTFNNPIAFYYS